MPRKRCSLGDELARLEESDPAVAQAAKKYDQAVAGILARPVSAPDTSANRARRACEAECEGLREEVAVLRARMAEAIAAGLAASDQVGVLDHLADYKSAWAARDTLLRLRAELERKEQP